MQNFFKFFFYILLIQLYKLLIFFDRVKKSFFKLAISKFRALNKIILFLILELCQFYFMFFVNIFNYIDFVIIINLEKYKKF